MLPSCSSVLSEAFAMFMCVRTSQLSLECWGQNNFGQLGDGTIGTDRLTPVDPWRP